jgi:uncharacterized protein (DUF433 family)
MYLGILEDVSRAKIHNSLKFPRDLPRLSAQMYLVLSKSGRTVTMTRYSKTRKAYQLLMFPVCYNGLYMKEERTQYHERIVTDPRILAGKPVVKGTRIAVDLVLEELSLNPDVTELLAAHPDLTRDDVQACLAYAKDILTGQEVSPKPPRGARSNASL